MKIKKVDDKPMVIHTKEKAKIHTHNPKQAKIKGSNIYTVERGPKNTKASVEKAKATDAKNRNVNATEAKKSLSEDDKVDKTTVSSEDVEVDRRYLITTKGAKPDYLLPVKFFDENAGYDAFAPRESIRIKKSGSGLNFVHGGISLQEMVVPVVDYTPVSTKSKAYKRNAGKYDTKPVELNLLSANRTD